MRAYGLWPESPWPTKQSGRDSAQGPSDSAAVALRPWGVPALHRTSLTPGGALPRRALSGKLREPSGGPSGG